MRGSDDSEALARALANQRALNRLAWILGCGLALALTAPPVFFAATLSSFTGLGAGIVATVALFGRDDVFAATLTRWDVAAALYAMSLLCGMFVDFTAVQHHLMLVDAGLR